MPRPAARLKPPPRTPSRAAPERQRVNLSLKTTTVEQARALGLNISRLTEEHLQRAIREEKARRWAEDNREAIEHHSKRIERDGMWNKDLIAF